MAVSIDWANRIIFVPKADLTFLGGSLYELDTNWFRIQLKDLEDNEAGQVNPDTHKHNTTVLLGGIEYARIIEIINGYTITFEDGQYAVNLVGSNNNIADVTNVNQVSIRPNNSAGLIQTREIQYAAFGGGVHIDTINGVDDTTYPAGTPRLPVNNMTAAMLIAQLYGFGSLHVLSPLTLTTGDDITGFVVEGANPLKTIITVETGAVVENVEFTNVSLTGILDNGAIARDSYVYDLDFVNGFLHECMLSGTITLGGIYPAQIMSCYSSVNGVTFDCGGSGQILNVSGFHGNMTIANKTGTDPAVIHATSASITIDASVTNGIGLHIDGTGDLVNNSSIVPEELELVSNEAIADEVWISPTDNTTPGTMGEKVRQSLSVAKFLGLK